MNQKTILVMEDNDDINLLIKTTLTYKGYKVLSAFNGHQGLELVKKNPVDMIILDVMMPDMDGYEVLEKLKSDKTTEQIPVAFLSAKSQQSEIDKGISMGAVRYFIKPFIPMDLLNEVSLILNNDK